MKRRLHLHQRLSSLPSIPGGNLFTNLILVYERGTINLRIVYISNALLPDPAKKNMETNDRISNFNDLHDETLRQFMQVRKDFEENNERLEINKKKMGKDKRAFTESLKANFDLLMSAENQIELPKGFSV